MKKLLSFFLCAALAAGILSGCSGPGGTTSSTASQGQASSESQKPVNLRFMWWGGDERHQATLKVIDSYKAKHSNVTIDAEYSGADGYLEKLSTQLYSGTAAELIQNGPGWVPDLISKGDFFIDFNNYKDKINLTGFDSDYLKNTCTYDGKLVGLPSGVAGGAYLVNTTLTQKAGIDLSKSLTWDGLVEAGKKLQAYDSSKYLLNIDTVTVNTEILRPYLLQLTGNTAIVDKTKSMGFTRDELIQVLNYIKSLYDNKVVQPAGESAAFKNNTATNPKWIAGDFASALCVSSTINTFTSACTSAQFDVVNLPKLQSSKNDGFYPSPPQLMCIPKTAEKDPDKLNAALSFFDYFFNDATAAQTLKDLRSVPAVKSAKEVCVQNNLIKPIVSKSVDIILAMKGTNEMGLTTSAEIDTILVDMIENVAYGKKPVDQIADESIKLIQGVLANQ